MAGTDARDGRPSDPIDHTATVLKVDIDTLAA